MKGMSISGLSAVGMLMLLGLVMGEISKGANVTHEPDTNVRTFLPVHYNKMKKKPGMITFNISSIEDEEEILKARLHIHHQTSKQYFHQDPEVLPEPGKAIIYMIRTRTSSPRRVVALPVALSHGGWINMDLTSELNEVHGLTQFLGISFQGPRRLRVKALSCYLVVVSKYDAEEKIDEGKERHMKHKDRKYDDNELSNEIEVVKRRDEKRRFPHRVHRRVPRIKSQQETKRRREMRIIPFLHIDEMSEMQRGRRKY